MGVLLLLLLSSPEWVFEHRVSSLFVYRLLHLQILVLLFVRSSVFHSGFLLLLVLGLPVEVDSEAAAAAVPEP